MLDSADAAENKITVELSLVCMWGGWGGRRHIWLQRKIKGQGFKKFWRKKDFL